MLGKHKALAAGLPDTSSSIWYLQLLHRVHGDVVLEAETDYICAQPPSSGSPCSNLTSTAGLLFAANLTMTSAPEGPHIKPVFTEYRLWWHASGQWAPLSGHTFAADALIGWRGAEPIPCGTAHVAPV